MIQHAVNIRIVSSKHNQFCLNSTNMSKNRIRPTSIGVSCAGGTGFKSHLSIFLLLLSASK